jgi:hypothetical protein
MSRNKAGISILQHHDLSRRSDSDPRDAGVIETHPVPRFRWQLQRPVRGIKVGVRGHIITISNTDQYICPCVID